MRKTVYVILALCCFIIKTYSINRPYYHFKQLSIKEGLPTSITSLYDDKNGSLWVGTTQGIYRFNGEKIKKYNLPDLLRKTAITSTIFSEKMKSGYGRSPHKESVIMNMRKTPCKSFCGIINR